MYRVLKVAPRGWQARVEAPTRTCVRWWATSGPLPSGPRPFFLASYRADSGARISGDPSLGLLRADHESDSQLRVRDQERPAREQGALERLKGRKMVEWTLAYLALAWLALQLTDVLAEIWDWPIQLQRSLTLVAGMGIFPALVVAWFHGEKGRQRICCTEAGLVALMLLGTAALVVRFCF